jgi:hypothetical protein
MKEEESSLGEIGLAPGLEWIRFSAEPPRDGILIVRANGDLRAFAVASDFAAVEPLLDNADGSRWWRIRLGPEFGRLGAPLRELLRRCGAKEVFGDRLAWSIPADEAGAGGRPT